MPGTSRRTRVFFSLPPKPARVATRDSHRRHHSPLCVVVVVVVDGIHTKKNGRLPAGAFRRSRCRFVPVVGFTLANRARACIFSSRGLARRRGHDTCSTNVAPQKKKPSALHTLDARGESRILCTTDRRHAGRIAGHAVFLPQPPSDAKSIHERRHRHTHAHTHTLERQDARMRVACVRCSLPKCLCLCVRSRALALAARGASNPPQWLRSTTMRLRAGAQCRSALSRRHKCR